VEGDRQLVLVPNDSNKLLMKWKGPFVIVKKIGDYDYQVIVGRKLKTHHVRQLITRRLHQRVAPENEAARAGGVVLEIVSSAIVEVKDDTVEETEDDDGLELRQATESWADVKLGDNLNKMQRKQAREIVIQFRERLANLPGTTNLASHQVTLTNNEPIRCKPYMIPFTIREALRKDISDMLNLGVIRESNSPYAFPVVLVRKKDRSNGVCIECRKLNKITVVDPDPSTPVIDLMQKLCSDRYY
jgi:hypothetical protein